MGKDGFITGLVTSNNFNSFFYSKEEEITLIEPPHQEQFVVQELQQPIPAVLVQAKAEDIHEEHRERVQKRPLVVMLHGGPHDCFTPALTCLRYSLLKLGYALLFPNIPGSTSYGQEYLHGCVGGIGEKDVVPLL